MDNLQNAKYAIDRSTGDYGRDKDVLLAIAYALIAQVEKLEEIREAVSVIAMAADAPAKFKINL